jgi:hypothetical protein
MGARARLPISNGHISHHVVSIAVTALHKTPGNLNKKTNIRHNIS